MPEKSNKFYNGRLFIFAIPMLYAFLLRSIFLDEAFDVIVAGIASITFLIFVPVAIGALVVALTPVDLSTKILYGIFAPWGIIIIFLLLSFLIKFEGAICLIMAAPIFLISSSTGGFIMSLVKRSRLNNKMNIVIAALLPFFISPIESSLNIEPHIYVAYTTITINAPKEKIWENVTRVKEIKETEDNGKLSKIMGFPRPIVAELDTLQIGGKRRAVFDKGLVFDELVNVYEHERKMSFSITPLTNEIPPETLDEHVTVGGKYFTVLDGTYELVPAGNENYNLILFSHFRMNTTFNFYSGLWAKLIMKDIQNNILNIIKKRCENN